MLRIEKTPSSSSQFSAEGGSAKLSPRISYRVAEKSGDELQLPDAANGMDIELLRATRQRIYSARFEEPQAADNRLIFSDAHGNALSFAKVASLLGAYFAFWWLFVCLHSPLSLLPIFSCCSPSLWAC